MTKNDIKRIVMDHKDILKKYEVKAIYLFGSFSRDEQKEDSDIDLLVEFEKSTYRNYINLIYSLENLFKKEVTIVTKKGLDPYVRPYILKEAEKIEG